MRDWKVNSRSILGGNITKLHPYTLAKRMGLSAGLKGIQFEKKKPSLEHKIGVVDVFSFPMKPFLHQV